jgi:methyl-accepting chemotaxis protein
MMSHVADDAKPIFAAHSPFDELAASIRASLREYAQRIDRVLDRLEAAANSLERAAAQFEAASRPVTEPTQTAAESSWLRRLVGRA